MPVFSRDLTDSLDDGFEYSSGIWENGYSLDIIDASNWGNAFNFQNIIIPQGTQIFSATLIFYGMCNANAANPIYTRFYAEDVDSGTAGRLSTKTLTTAFTEIIQDTDFSPDSAYGYWSIDVTSPVQEVLDRPGFASGNAMNIIIKRVSVSGGKTWDMIDAEGEGDYGCPPKNLTIIWRSAALTGTVTSATEADIVAGGKTIILTLTGATYVAAGAVFDSQRQNIINGIDSAQSEAYGWDAEVKGKEVVTAVVRTSSTVVTITLTAEAAYDITATETITATIPATAFTLPISLVASPTFNVVPVTAGRNFMLMGVG